MTSYEVAAADGTRLHYTVEGDGPVDFLLCDGLGCDGFIWRYLRPELKAIGRVIHLNMRGHGQSGVPVSPGRIEMSQLADDWMPVIEATASRSAIVLGHSMGVQVALATFAPVGTPVMLMPAGTRSLMVTLVAGPKALAALDTENA